MQHETVLLKYKYNISSVSSKTNNFFAFSCCLKFKIVNRIACAL